MYLIKSRALESEPRSQVAEEEEKNGSWGGYCPVKILNFGRKVIRDTYLEERVEPSLCRVREEEGKAGPSGSKWEGETVTFSWSPFSQLRHWSISHSSVLVLDPFIFWSQGQRHPKVNRSDRTVEISHIVVSCLT